MSTVPVLMSIFVVPPILALAAINAGGREKVELPEDRSWSLTMRVLAGFYERKTLVLPLRNRKTVGWSRSLP